MKKSILFTILWLMAFGCSPKPDSAVIHFGVLPVLQSLPLYVAGHNHYFGDESINVELTTFNSAADKDIAFSSGQLEGMFADLVTPIVLAGNGIPLRITATNYRSDLDHRMFAVLSKKGSSVTSIADLGTTPVSVSSNSVIDLTTDLLTRPYLPSGTHYQTLETKNIPVRLQLLLSGQLDAATLPEPLVTLAEKAGCNILADDSALPHTQTVFIFAPRYLDQYQESIQKFHIAIARANKFITENPDSARSIMETYIRIPDPLKGKIAIPTFPELDIPSEDILAEVQTWLTEKKVLKTPFAYNDLVNEKWRRPASAR